MAGLRAIEGGRTPAADAEDGTAAPRRGRRRAHLLLLALVLGLNLFGAVMVLSASSVVAAEEGSTWSYFARQLMWLALGAAALGLTAVVDVRVWRRLSWASYAATLGLLLAVALPGVGVEVNGSQRWLPIGPIRIQPSEMVKLTLLLVLADQLDRRQRYLSDHRVSVNRPLLVAAPAALLVFGQPDLGTTLILASIVASVLWAAGAPLRPLVVVALIGVSAAAIAAVVAPYRRARVMAFLDPWADPLDQTYQSLQSLVGVASGGLEGVGLGASRAKWGFLPNAHTDFIYAIVGEELGLVGTLGVLLAFAVFGLVALGVATHAEDLFGCLLATGITTWLLVQAFVNIGGVVGLLPITGVTLPFVSFGGTSLVTTMAAAGLLLNLSRRTA